MQLQVEARLDYDFHGPVEALLHLEVAHWPGQRILSEQLSLDPPIAWSRQDDPATGERRLVFAHAGPLKITYQALVDLDPADHALTGAAQATVASLPVEALPYLRPSRYVESDLFEQVAAADFAGLTGGDRVAAILDWMGRAMAYRAWASHATSSASSTYMSRAGVCRDFAHVAVALCRASDIPARMVSAYAPGLKPEDFHAVIEVYVGGRWRLADPTGLAQPDTLIRIGHGRDAADIPFLTIFGRATMTGQSVRVLAP